MEIKDKVMCVRCRQEMEYVKDQDWYWCGQCFHSIQIKCNESMFNRMSENSFESILD
jgi:DNA-directed RNA polymerase subunit RPC12/RpoP